MNQESTGARGGGPWPWVITALALALAGYAAFELRGAGEADRARAEQERLAREREMAERIAPIAQAAEEARAVQEAVTPAVEAPDATPEVARVPYDVEKTMRVVREIDLALRSTGSVREYLDVLARQDYRGVDAGVLASRARILEVLAKYYAALERREQEEELWRVFGRWSDEFAKMIGSVDFDASTPLGSVRLSPADPERARLLAEERAHREQQRRAAFSEVQRFEEELLYALDAAVPAFREVEDDWARLCLQRDRAYLEAYDLRFAEARRSAAAALAMAPNDEESRLLLALATIEGGPQEGGATSETRPDALPDAGELLNALLHENPDSAPALLMRGVWHARNGRTGEARGDLELAMTRYPEQAERLRDELDPYRSRKYLGLTRQGGRITGLYQSMMLGASWFSPELQTARLDLATGDRERAFERIRDHFARRRAQGQWELVLYDIRFCEDLLGPDFRGEYFPERSYLDLRVERNTFGKDLTVQVDNRSDRSLHNATLVLCVRFTDMHPEDYATIAVGPTQPIVPAISRTTFGDLDVDRDWGGIRKTADDIVPPLRAILVSDEAVSWIDSIEYKDEAIARFGTLGAAPQAVASSLTARLQEVVDGLGLAAVKVERVDNLIRGDDLRIELPREVVLLGPLFRLEIAGKSFDEAKAGEVKNRIQEGKVRLEFSGAGDALDGEPAELRLLARSAIRSVVFVLERGPEGGYSLARVEKP